MKDNALTEKNRISYVMIYLILAVAVVFVSTIDSSNMFHPTLPQIDSSVFRYVALVMKNGGVMYRDVFDHKGPVIYLLNYVGMMIDYRNGIWIVEIVSLYIATIFTYKAMKRFLKPGLAMAGTLICIFQIYPFNQYGGNYVEEYAFPFITCSLYIFVQYFQDNRTTPFKLAACGFCFMAVLLLRPNMIGTWIVFAITVLGNEIRQKSKKWIAYILWFLLGALVPLVPILIYLKLNGALHDFVEQYMIFNVSYTGDMRSNQLQAMMHFLSMGIVVVSLMILVVALFVEEKKEPLTVIWLIYIVVSIPLIAISGREFEHYGFLLVPLCTYPIARLIRFLSDRDGGKKYLWLVLGITIALLAYPYNHTIKQFRMTGTVDESMDGIIASFIKDHTDPEDTIIVSGTRDVVYFLSERLSASKYSYQSPIGEIVPTIYYKTMEDVAENKPVFIVLFTDEMNGKVFVKEINERLTEYAKGNGYTKQAEIYPFIVYWKKPDSEKL